MNSYTLAALAGAVLLAVVVAGLGPRASTPPEPVYNGQPVSRWLHQLSYGAPAEAGAAFREMGAEAVPWLLERIKQNKRSPAQHCYAWIHSQLPGALARRCPSPKPIEEHLPARVAVALSHTGAKSLPMLASAINDRSADVRLAAIDALKMLQAGDVTLQPVLQRAVGDSDHRVRASAAEGIRALATTNGAAITLDAATRDN